MSSAASARKRLMGLAHIAYLSLIAGGLVAGSDAGKFLNNWPFYGKDFFIPEDASELEPWYRNFTENRSMIQFTHRTLGYLTYIQALRVLVMKNKEKLLISTRFGIYGVFALVNLQVFLGIRALWSSCGERESLEHHANALILLTAILFTAHTVRRPPKAFIKSLSN